MIGLIKLALGLARLGALVNFISTTVIIGFTAGAGLLIIARAAAEFFRPRRAAAPGSFVQTRWRRSARHAREIDPWTAAVGVVTLVAALGGRRVLPRVPYMLTGMIVGSVFAYALARAGVAQVATVGALPSALAAAVAAGVLRATRGARSRRSRSR